MQQRKKKELENKSPIKTKRVLILKGNQTSQIITDVLQDISLLFKPNCKHLTRKNDILPFEDINSIEFLSQKNDCSLFAMGSHSKKRPHNLILVTNLHYLYFIIVINYHNTFKLGAFI